LAESSDADEDIVSGLGPDKGPGLGVGLVDIGLNSGLKAVGVVEGAALEAAAGEQREPAFDQLELRR
jgi:hypothetical protein